MSQVKHNQGLQWTLAIARPTEPRRYRKKVREMDFEKGRTYYMVTFADAQQTMPGINPVIYVGKNVLESGQGGADSYCFQDTVSFQRFGSVAENEGVEDCILREFSDEEAGTSVVDLLEVRSIIEEAVEKFEQFGHPKLKVLRNGWV